MEENADSLQVRFKKCEWGWVDFIVTAGPQSVETHATDWDDPFEAMMVWLEQLTARSATAQFSVNEEGHYKDFIVRRVSEQTCQLQIVGRPDTPSECQPETLLQTEVSWRGLVEAFYAAFREFTESERYDPRQWEYQSCRTHMREVFGPSDEDNVERLLDGTVNEAAACFPTALAECSPEEAAWPNWTREERRHFLTSELDGPFRSWSGTPLRGLRSETVEKWLTSSGRK